MGMYASSFLALIIDAAQYEEAAQPIVSIAMEHSSMLNERVR